jgi:uncharacterized membrane protein YoaK (UPF0700 family)
MGAFFAGLVLAARSSAGKFAPVRLNYPNAHEWRWQHQVLTSACLLCIGVSHSLLQDVAGAASCTGASTASTASIASTASTVSVALCACCAAMLNCLLVLSGSQFVVLRASNVTGAITDSCVLIGSWLRSRCRRHLWKAKLQAASFCCFALGSLVGAIVFEDGALRCSSLAAVFAMILPLWLAGVCFLLDQLRRCRKRDSLVLMQDKRNHLIEAPAGSRRCADVPNGGASTSLRATAAGEGDILPFAAGPSALPRLDVLGDFPEFESEGVGAAIGFLPRINVLEDAQLSEGFDGAASQSSAAAPGEFETLDYLHFVWIMYLSFAAGALDAVGFVCVFRVFVTHVTGSATNMAFKLRYPPRMQDTGASSASSLTFACVILAFGLGCFVGGFALTSISATHNRQYVIRRIDYPSSGTWKWQHQLIISLSIASLCISHAIARDVSGGAKDFAATISLDIARNTAFILACALCSFAAGLLNTLSSLGRRITVRTTHVTGTINDIFLGLGYALRSRSARYLWRVRLLLLTWIAFFAGAAAGAALFYSSFGASAVIFPAALLSLGWAVGVGLMIDNWWFQGRYIAF